LISEEVTAFKKIYDNMKLSNNKILITGGATGIGLALAQRFVNENNTVIVCGRRESALREAADRTPSLITRVCNLSVAREREELFDWINSEHKDLNVLINNAGIQQWMSVSDSDFFQRATEEIRTNIEAPLHLISLFLKLSSLTTIVNVGSGLAFATLAKVPVYSASKAFIHSFTLSLRHLLKQKNIEVIELIPPALNTDLGGKGIHDFAPPVDDFIEASFEKLKIGELEITFGMSEGASKASPEDLKKTFERMNAG